MVSTENQRKKTLLERFLDGDTQILAGIGNFLHILGALFADGHFLRLLHGDVADILDLETEMLDARLQTGDAKRGRAHVHAAAAGAEVHGYADDANFVRHKIAPWVVIGPQEAPAREDGLDTIDAARAPSLALKELFC